MFWSKQDEYDKAVQHGLNSSDGDDFLSDLGRGVIDTRSDTYKKGEQHGRDLRHANEARAAAEAKSSRAEESSSNCSSSDYGSSDSYSRSHDCNGNDDYSVGGWVFLWMSSVIVVLILIFSGFFKWEPRYVSGPVVPLQRGSVNPE